MSCGCAPSVCLASGMVNLFTVISSPASSGSTEFLRVLFYHMVQNLRDVVTPAWSRLVMSSIGTKVWSEFYLNCWLILRDEVTLWVETVLGLILDRNEDFSDFLFGWFRAFAMGSPFGGSSLRCGLTHSIETEASFWTILQDPLGCHPFRGQVACNLTASEGLSWCELMAAYCSTLLHWSMLVRMCYI